MHHYPWLISVVLQWLTAGRGFVHTEMPSGEESCYGLQLWINLTSGDKMVEPTYQDIKKEDIPFESEGGARVRVIAGEALGKKVSV